MGKLKGIVQFTGSFDNLSFYQLNGKIVVRRKGGFDGEKIKHQANYVRVRENSSEFAHCAKTGKYFRMALIGLLQPLRIAYVHNHVVCLFQKIITFDTAQTRGNRKVFTGLKTEHGHRAVLNFEFDKARSFGRFFPFKWFFDFENGHFSVFNFSTSSLKSPVGATHVRMQFHLIGLDFAGFTPPLLQSNDVVLVDLTSTEDCLPSFSFVPITSPFVFAVFEVQFLQEVNGDFKRLEGGGIKIVDVRSQN